MSKSQNVIFVPRDEQTSNILDFPKPAKNYIPDWYRNLSANWKNNNFSFAGPTRCMPFFDSFSSGYVHELVCDIEIKYDGINKDTKEDIVLYRWAEKFRPLMTRQEENGAPKSLPNFDGYYNAEFQWYTNWDPKTPKGYSTMYHHPSNRFDLPFHTFTGITDTDRWSGAGPVPFLIKKGFEGVIPAGTPIIQFTFIKREKWKSTAEEYDIIKHKKDSFGLKKYLIGGYKKHYWEKKEFL
jgi:hypothetical protein